MSGGLLSPGTAALILFGVFFVLLVLRVPVAFGPRSGQTSTSKCEPSRTPIIAPIITIQMKRKRAISSVQI